MANSAVSFLRCLFRHCVSADTMALPISCPCNCRVSKREMVCWEAEGADMWPGELILGRRARGIINRRERAQAKGGIFY